jgi:hypothetical protein
MQERAIPFTAAVLSYGVMLDPDGSIGIEKAAAQLAPGGRQLTSSDVRRRGHRQSFHDRRSQYDH